MTPRIAKLRLVDICLIPWPSLVIYTHFYPGARSWGSQILGLLR